MVINFDLTMSHPVMNLDDDVLKAVVCVAYVIFPINQFIINTSLDIDLMLVFGYQQCAPSNSTSSIQMNWTKKKSGKQTGKATAKICNPFELTCWLSKTNIAIILQKSPN